MKEVLRIQHFNAGIIGGLDERDVPLDAFVYSEGVNPAAIQGKLSGIETELEVVSDATYDATVTQASGGAGNVSASANYEAGDDVVMLDLSGAANAKTIVEITDIDGTPVVAQPGTGLTASGTPKAVISDGTAVHIGMGASTGATPQWVGEIDFDQFGGAVPSGTQVVDALLKRATLAGSVVSITFPGNATATEGQTVFEENWTYWYAVVFQYDGYQEGPLAQGYEAGSAAVAQFTVSGTTYGYSDVDVKVVINDDHADWSSRISGIILYRGGLEGASLSKWPEVEMEYVTTIAIDDASWAADGGNWAYTYTDSAIGVGATYSSRTGVSAAQREMDIYWGLSCASDQYHFVGHAVTAIQDANFDESERAIFRSQPYKFDMWDKQDFALLPMQPVAIAAFQGRIYAFSQNHLWVLDSATLSIVEETHGIGTFGPDSVIATDRGLFFVDRNNIYITDFDGRITPIGNPVLKNDVDAKAAYLSRSTGTDPVVVYDPKYDAFVVLYVNSASTVSYLMYRPQQAQTIDLPQGRWDHVLTTYTSLGTRIASNRTHPLVVLDGDIMELFGSATKKAWTVTLREMETPEYTKYYDIDILGDDVTVEYSEDGGAFAAASTSSYGTGVYRAEINGRSGRTWNRVHTHQVRLTGTNTQEVDSIAINRRRMARV